MLHDLFGVMASLSVSQVSCKVTTGSDFVTGIRRRMCGPCEGDLFPGIFMHQLLPDRTRFCFGRGWHCDQHRYCADNFPFHHLQCSTSGAAIGVSPRQRAKLTSGPNLHSPITVGFTLTITV